jgi:hypothetical protein
MLHRLAARILSFPNYRDFGKDNGKNPGKRPTSTKANISFVFPVLLFYLTP